MGIFHTKVVEKIKTHILCLATSLFFPKIVEFGRYCDTILYSRTGQRLQYGACVLHAWYLGLHTHTNTHRLCRTLCFSTTTMVAWTRLNVTLCAHCLVLLLNKINTDSNESLLFSFPLTPLSVRKKTWLSRYSCYDRAGTTKGSWFNSRPTQQTSVGKRPYHIKDHMASYPICTAVCFLVIQAAGAWI